MEIDKETFGVAGAIVLTALTLLFRKSKGTKEREKTAGEKSVEWWMQTFEQISEKAVRNALVTRNEDIRRIVREELERHRHR